jgi:hypothetical protein
MEHSTGAESDEPMYLHVAGPDPKEVQGAKELCEDLLANVRQQYERFKANPPPQRMESYTDGYGPNANHNSYGGRDSYRGRDPYGGNRDSYGGDRGARDSYSGGHNNSYGSPYSAAPTTPAPPGAVVSPTDYTAQYAQYYASQPGGDPYAAYGGYANYVANYQYYVQQQAQQPGSDQAPPPPPGGDASPPPPPGSAVNAGSPPPPGM